MDADQALRRFRDRVLVLLLICFAVNAALAGFLFAQARAFNDHVDQARALQHAAGEALRETIELRDRLKAADARLDEGAWVAGGDHADQVPRL